MLTANALFKSISDLVTGVNISIQSVLTYVYGFFEGALVMLTLFIVAFAILGSLLISYAIGMSILGVDFYRTFTAAASPAVLAQVPIMSAIAFVFIGVAAAFFDFPCRCYNNVNVCRILKGCIHDVQSRKTSTPMSPIREKYFMYNIKLWTMKLCSCNLSENMTIIFLLFLIVVLLSLYFDLPTVEYVNQLWDGEVSILQINNLRK